MTRVVLIPSYQPKEVLIYLICKLRKNNFNIVVVDDGSGEEFAEIFQEVSMYSDVISYPQNHGKGYALKKGLKYIKDNYENATVVTMDGDGQHLVEDAIRLCKEVEDNEGFFILGSRKLSKGAPNKSKLGNGITRFVYRSITGCKIYDTQSGLRAFSTAWLDRLMAIEGDRYEYEMNVLLYIARYGLPIREIPIKVIYFDKKNSVSHFNAVSDSAKIYKEILKFAGSSFASFLIDYSLYAVLVTVAGSAFMVFANLMARAVSSLFNFCLNKRIVFKNENGSGKDTAIKAIKYYGLVIFNIAVNTLLLSIITGYQVNVYLAKIIVELVMFGFSYIVQHYFIFNTTRTKVIDMASVGREDVLCEKDVFTR